jgi:hypothetical protein
MVFPVIHGADEGCGGIKDVGDDRNIYPMISTNICVKRKRKATKH